MGGGKTFFPLPQIGLGTRLAIEQSVGIQQAIEQSVGIQQAIEQSVGIQQAIEQSVSIAMFPGSLSFLK